MVNDNLKEKFGLNDEELNAIIGGAENPSLSSDSSGSCDTCTVCSSCVVCTTCVVLGCSQCTTSATATIGGRG
jgi:bacteriocin-like protein